MEQLLCCLLSRIVESISGQGPEEASKGMELLLKSQRVTGILLAMSKQHSPRVAVSGARGSNAGWRARGTQKDLGQLGVVP